MRTTLALMFVAMTACGGGKPAKTPDAETPPSSNDESPKWESGSTTRETPPTKSTAAAVNEQPKQRTDQYDKEQTEIVLKRAARQVKENCGATKDDTGKATGPWGKVTVQVLLGHNGHGQVANVPPPYKGKPTGNCVERAFSNLTFPPWSGSDTTIDWEVELVQPAEPPKK